MRYGLRLATVLVAVSTWVLLGAVAEACPSCRDGLAQGPQANTVRGVFYSILFMMSMPFVICGGLGAYFYLLVRRARLQSPVTANAGSAPAPLNTAQNNAAPSELAVSNPS